MPRQTTTHVDSASEVGSAPARSTRRRGSEPDSDLLPRLHDRVRVTDRGGRADSVAAGAPRACGQAGHLGELARARQRRRGERLRAASRCRAGLTPRTTGRGGSPVPEARRRRIVAVAARPGGGGARSARVSARRSRGGDRPARAGVRARAGLMGSGCPGHAGSRLLQIRGDGGLDRALPAGAGAGGGGE